MNTLKGNEEAVRRGLFGAVLCIRGVGELSDYYVMDLSSRHEKKKGWSSTMLLMATVVRSYLMGM